MDLCKSLLLLLVIFCAVNAISIQRYPREAVESKPGTAPEAAAVVPNTEAEENDNTDKEELTGRFNLNFGQSASQAFGPGGASNSVSGTRVVNVGLVGPYGSSYTPLHRDSLSFSHSNQFGYNAPQTWAGSGGRYGGQGGNSHVSSGFRGGIGNSNSQAYNVQHRIPVGNGLTLLSNLQSGEPEGSDAAAAPST